MSHLLRSRPITTALVLGALLASSVSRAFAAGTSPPATGPVRPERVVAALEKYIKTKFEEPRNLKIKLALFDDPQRLQRGHFREVAITTDSALFDGIAMEDLLLSAKDVMIDLPALFSRNHLETTQREHGIIRATVTEAHLNKAFQSVKMPIHDFQMSFVENGVVATGTYKFIVGNRLQMHATLEPKPDGIWFLCQRASVNGLALPSGQVRALLNKMNPIIDFTKLPFSPKVRKIAIDGEKKVLSIT
jgi:hypothetical protein